MHDPSTLAFEIPYPWKTKSKDPRFPGYRNPLLTIWHEDPGCDGTDDSCGWFKRSRHGDKKVLEAIIKRYDFDWDRKFQSEYSGKLYYVGLFYPSNEGSMAPAPVLSTMGVTLNLFFMAAHEVFKHDWKRANAFCQKHLFDILFFAENPTDSLSDSINLKFGNDIGREERIRNFAQTVYGFILRKQQRWWQHPRWHVHHWRIQFHPWEQLKKRFRSVKR